MSPAWILQSPRPAERVHVIGYNPPSMTDPPPPVITRFAPSPTGALHIGGARTALFNWAYAKRHNGRFLLRLEDTDQKRSSQDAVNNILEALKWLGIDVHNADDIPRQSDRLDLYREKLEQLKAADRVYEKDGAWWFRMPPEDVQFIDEVRGSVTVPASDHKDFVVFKTDGYPTYHFAVTVDDAAMGVTHVIRGVEHLMNTAKHIALQQALDLPRPTYAHLSLIFNPDGSKMSKRDKAKAARKAAQKHLETHEREPFVDALLEEWTRQYELIRTVTGDDPESSAPPDKKTINAFIDGDTDDIAIAEMIAEYLDCALPPINVIDFRDEGFLAAPLVNYLALLGWNPGDDIETFNPDFLAAHFDFDRVIKGNAKFDREKLRAFNADAIRARDADQFASELAKYAMETIFRYDSDLQNAPWKAFFRDEPDRAKALATAYQERITTLKDALSAGRFILPSHGPQQPDDYDPKAVKKVMLKGDPNGVTVLAMIHPMLEAIDEDHWTVEHLETTLRQWAEQQNLGMGKFAQPLRVALSGNTVTPPIFDTLALVGRTETLQRIATCPTHIRALQAEAEAAP